MLRIPAFAALGGLFASGFTFAFGPDGGELQDPEDLQALPRISWNDNREPAGSWRGDVLELDLEIVEGDWRLLGDDEPGGRVLAFAERGGQPSTPGPLIRIPRGTEVRVGVTNRADSLIVIRGFGDRRDGDLQPLRVAAGATEWVSFTADVEGTYFYWGSLQGRPLPLRRFEDSQLTGAFVVDGEGLSTSDRIMVIGEWMDGRLPNGDPDPTRLFLTINGRPWPHVERMEYELGDSVQWRVINTSLGSHAFHLHGFFYQVNAKGDVARDTLYWPAQRRSAVTERMPTGTTMHMEFVPDRPGGWIFHCHMSIHVVPNPAMGGERITAAQFTDRLYREEHRDHTTADHARDGMGGLVTSVYVRPPPGWEPEEVSRREVNLFVQSRPATGGFSGSQFAYVLQEGDVAPAPDSVVLPGSTLLLRRDEPTRIRVTNRTPEPTQVHWHGLEIESYFDGVAGVGGYPTMTTPIIQPGDFWDVYVTPDRAGSYMYHTHVNDLRQQGSGLYAPLIVLEPEETWDPVQDRVFIFGESPFRDDQVPVVNGGQPSVEPLRVGTTYRIRLMQITSNRPETYTTLLQDGFPVVWTPVAKDAFDLPETQRIPQIAQQKIAVGETYDRLYTPTQPGTLHLELRVGNGVLLIDHEIPVER
jgi:FtsP/CotA-like multicopper oxidase with cupredoxin domain